MVCRALALFAALGLVASAPAQVSFQFDYSLDTGGFFTGANSGRQSYLVTAGSYVTNLIAGTTLLGIAPGGGNSWNASVFHPGNGSGDYALGNIAVAANTITVYAGGYDIFYSGVLALSGPATYTATGDQTWLDLINSRGNGSYNLTSVGSISFDSVTNWYFDPDVASIEGFTGRIDFFSVAVHEMLHLVGFGTGNTWNDLISGSSFTGAVSEANYLANPGSPVPLSSDQGHWAAGTMSTVIGTGISQSALMAPSIAYGVREYVTVLDVAGLQDIGYVTAIPEPAELGVLFGGVIFLGVVWHRRKRSGESGP